MFPLYAFLRLANSSLGGRESPEILLMMRYWLEMCIFSDIQLPALKYSRGILPFSTFRSDSLFLVASDFFDARAQFDL
jgi:hypothetical protein